jgi:hypothetical protein
MQKRGLKEFMDKKAQSYILVIIVIILIIIGLIWYMLIPKTNIIINNSQINYSLYPNPNLTPGDVLSTNTSIICVKGYTATVRDVPLSLRKKIFAMYNISYPPVKGAYELDHFIPLELGGSNDEKNLFPELDPYFHYKDKVENYLHDQVCNHGMSIIDAQNQIKTDWYAVYLQIK